MILNFINKHKDVGLLILRLGFGAMFIYHGLPKMLGGPQSWEHLGTAMANYGITNQPEEGTSGKPLSCLRRMRAIK